jgi:hypothetical protein
MHLVEIKDTKGERTSPSPPATQVHAPKANHLSNSAPMRVRKGQHLDVDGILARSLPNSIAFPAPGIKTIVSR